MGRTHDAPGSENPAQRPSLPRRVGRRAWRIARGVRTPARPPDPAHHRRSARHLWRSLAELTRWRARATLAGKRLVLIVLPERLGDIVACEPLIGEVRRRHPNDIVLWVIRPAFVPLLAGHPGLDGLLEIECVNEWAQLSRTPLCDVVYDLLVEGKPCPGCGTTLSKRFGDPSINTENYYDHGPLLQAFSRAAGLNLGAEITSLQPRLRFPTRLPEAVEHRLPRGAFVSVHASSDEESRSWTVDGWRAMAEHAWRRHGLPVVEVGLSPVLGPGNAEGHVDLTGRCTILETAEVIRRSSLFVGIDSGPAHLANAAGTPGLILLGQYRKWSEYIPYTGCYADPAHATLVRHEGPPAELPLARSLAALDEMVQRLGIGSPPGSSGRAACCPGASTSVVERIEP